MLQFQKIREDDATPKYYQIYKIIKDLFVNGAIKPGEILPSEKILMQGFGVSRVTIRTVMDKLETEGYILKKPGYGTVVLDYSYIYRAKQLSNLSTVLPTVRSKFISLEIVVPEKKIQTLLQLNGGEKVYKLTRLRAIEDENIVFGSAYIVMHEPIHLTRDMFNETTSLYKTLTDQGLKIGGCDETVEARIPGSTKIMGMDNASVLFYRERVTYTSDGRPFEFDSSYCNASLIKYSISSGSYSHMILRNNEREEKNEG